jgi:hypothetical protein
MSRLYQQPFSMDQQGNDPPLNTLNPTAAWRRQFPTMLSDYLSTTLEEKWSFSMADDCREQYSAGWGGENMQDEPDRP